MLERATSNDSMGGPRRRRRAYGSSPRSACRPSWAGKHVHKHPVVATHIPIPRARTPLKRARRGPHTLNPCRAGRLQHPPVLKCSSIFQEPSGSAAALPGHRQRHRRRHGGRPGLRAGGHPSCRRAGRPGGCWQAACRARPRPPANATTNETATRERHARDRSAARARLQRSHRGAARDCHARALRI
eukprot:1794233-Prymnesium_polylepis.1